MTLILELMEGSQYLVGLAAIKMACSMPDSVPETVCITFNALTVVSASECPSGLSGSALCCCMARRVSLTSPQTVFILFFPQVGRPC